MNEHAGAPGPSGMRHQVARRVNVVADRGEDLGGAGQAPADGDEVGTFTRCHRVEFAGVTTDDKHVQTLVDHRSHVELEGVKIEPLVAVHRGDRDHAHAGERSDQVGPAGRWVLLDNQISKHISSEIVGEVHDTTARLQADIDRCAEPGGGVVTIAAGRYVVGTLVLRSGVHLHLEPGCTLFGSTDLNDYPRHVPALGSYSDNYTVRSIIYAESATDVGITGRGTLDGQGAAFLGNEYLDRPYMMRFVDCDRVRVRDVTLRNSAMWVQHYLGCRDVLVDGVTVSSHSNINNDGIDIDSCERVRIANCDIASEDDAIVIKATAPRPCRDVVVTNCVLQSDCNAFKIGTETVGDISDVVFSNSTIRECGRSAIAIETVDGGSLERVLVSTILFRSSVGGIFVRLGHRGRPFEAVGTADYYDNDTGPAQRSVGTMRDITISNVIGEGCDTIGCSITGHPDAPIRDIRLHDVRMTFEGNGVAPVGAVPEQLDKYPEYNMFGPLPAFGLYARHVVGLRLDDVDLRALAPDGRPPLVLDDVVVADDVRADRVNQ